MTSICKGTEHEKAIIELAVVVLKYTSVYLMSITQLSEQYAEQFPHHSSGKTLNKCESECLLERRCL